MMWLITKFLSSLTWLFDKAKKGFNWFIKDATTKQRLMVTGFVILFLVTAVFSYQCSVIRENARQAEIQRLKRLEKEANLKGDLKGIEVIQEKIKVLDEKAEQQAIETQESEKKDSKEFDGAEADDAFCSHYCWDSSCVEWLKKDGCKE